MTNSLSRARIPVSSLQDFTNFNSLFDEWLLGNTGAFGRESAIQSSRSSLVVRPILEDNNTAAFEIEVPGIDPSEVKVRIEGRSLSVETPRGNAYVTIGQRLVADDATASLKHGLLTIRIPKRDARIVEVQVHEE